MQSLFSIAEAAASGCQTKEALDFWLSSKVGAFLIFLSSRLGLLFTMGVCALDFGRQVDSLDTVPVY